MDDDAKKIRNEYMRTYRRKNKNKVKVKQKRHTRMNHAKNDLRLSLARNNLLNNRSRFFNFSSSGFIT